MAQPQVVAPGHPHARREQLGIPPGGVVPHPARLLGLTPRNVGDDVVDNLRAAIVVRRRDDVVKPREDEVHDSSVPRTADHSGWSGVPSFFKTIFSPASIGIAKRFCFGGSGQL